MLKNKIKEHCYLLCEAMKVSQISYEGSQCTWNTRGLLYPLFTIYLLETNWKCLLNDIFWLYSSLSILFLSVIYHLLMLFSTFYFIFFKQPFMSLGYLINVFFFLCSWSLQFSVSVLIILASKILFSFRRKCMALLIEIWSKKIIHYFIKRVFNCIKTEESNNHLHISPWRK